MSREGVQKGSREGVTLPGWHQTTATLGCRCGRGWQQIFMEHVCSFKHTQNHPGVWEIFLGTFFFGFSFLLRVFIFQQHYALGCNVWVMPGVVSWDGSEAGVKLQPQPGRQCCWHRKQHRKLWKEQVHLKFGLQ